MHRNIVKKKKKKTTQEYKAMSQMKEPNKITARELNEIQISNMPYREFKVIVIKILTGLE